MRKYLIYLLAIALLSSGILLGQSRERFRGRGAIAGLPAGALLDPDLGGALLDPDLGGTLLNPDD